MSDRAAIQALEAALQAAPDNLALRKHLASLLAAEGRYSEAVKHYRRALDQSPNDAVVKLALAEAYYGQGKDDVALVVLEDLMRAKAASPKALKLAARLYLQSGQPIEAAHAYQQAIAADPGLADAGLAAELGIPAAGKSSEDAREEPPETPPEPEQAKKEMVFVAGKDAPDPASLYEIERPRTGFDDVGGMDKLKEEIRIKILYPLTQPGPFRTRGKSTGGKSTGGGIMMYGPPGCGKTHLARATAGEVDAAFLSIVLHDVLDKYTGQSERNLHQVFELARLNAPCVLFFDGIDALGGNRAGTRFDAMRQGFNQLLAEMDGVDASNEGVLILAATNTPWYVDPALRRPGRFDRVLFIPPPDVMARDAILRLLLKDKPTAQIDYPRLARETREFSGADLKSAVDQAMEQKLSMAMRSGTPAPLTTSDLLDAIHQQRPTTVAWFETARSYAVNANEGGLYDEVLAYLKIKR